MAAGSGATQPPITLINTANAVSEKYFRPVLIDSIFKPSPTWWSISRMGQKFSGGLSIVVPVSYLEETTGGAYWGANLLDTTMVDSVQPAEWRLKHYYQSIVVPYTDVLYNDGPGQILDLVKVKTEVAMASLLQKLARAIWGTSPQNTALDLDSLPSAVKTTNNTYGDINRATAANAFWIPGNNLGPNDASTAELTQYIMQQAYSRVTFGNEEPDRFLMDGTQFTEFWSQLIGNIRYTRDEETTRAGFKRHLVFNNATVMQDSYVPAGEVYVLNTKYICPYFHSKDYFVIDPFIKPSNQRVLVSGIFVTMNVLVLNPRMQNCIINLDTTPSP